MVFFSSINVGLYGKLTFFIQDDLCAVGPASDNSLDIFYAKYLWVCKEVGVALAPTDDPEKCFPPSTRGSILGIQFCTEDWVWWLAPEKIDRYVNDVNDLIIAGEGDLRTVQSVVGKLQYVSILIPSSKYHMSALLLINQGEDPNMLVKLTLGAKRQLEWWRTMLRLCTRMPIPRPYDRCPAFAVPADSDASGGSIGAAGRGCGIVLGKGWAWLPWPAYINSEQISFCCRVRWKHKLSWLELCGHFLHLACFPLEVQSRVVCTKIDNDGSIIKAEKGRMSKMKSIILQSFTGLECYL